MRTSWGSATDSGRVRSLNEDAVLAYPPVFLVADGMGGHQAGDVASRLVVEEFSRLAGRDAATADDVHGCFHRAARRLREELDGITAGTTVAGVAVARHDDGGSYWLVFNIGDSRVYRLVGDVLEQISVDHSVVQELVDRGVISPSQAREHPERHVITRALGTDTEPEPDYWMIPAGASDRVLICSDGLTAELDDPTIARLLGHDPDPREAARHLVETAVGAGGKDNVSAVVVDVAVTTGRLDGAPQDGAAESWDPRLEDTTRPRPARPAGSTGPAEPTGVDR